MPVKVKQKKTKEEQFEKAFEVELPRYQPAFPIGRPRWQAYPSSQVQAVCLLPANCLSACLPAQAWRAGAGLRPPGQSQKASQSLIGHCCAGKALRPIKSHVASTFGLQPLFSLQPAQLCLAAQPLLACFLLRVT